MYLGLFSQWCRCKRSLLSSLRRKCLAELTNGWKRFLSSAKNEGLIKYVIKAILLIWCVFSSSQRPLFRFYKGYFPVLWKEGNAKGIHWIRWYILMHSKYHGGQGFWDLSLINSTLLAKQAWCFYTYLEALWVHILFGLHLTQDFFLRWACETTILGMVESCTWQECKL